MSPFNLTFLISPHSIWFKGGCSQCFENVTTGKLSNDTEEFLRLHNSLENCFDDFADGNQEFNSSDYGRSKCCHVCKDKFNALIEKYHDIKDK